MTALPEEFYTLPRPLQLRSAVEVMQAGLKMLDYLEEYEVATRLDFALEELKGKLEERG